jgi:SAM-dependent methyltransferase
VTTGMYTRAEFERQRERSAAAARAIVPIVLQLTSARSVVDVGCGVGTWLRAFADSGIDDYLGVDGHYVDGDLLQIPRERFLTADLREPISTGRRFDLACSLEVAEHLPPERAESFVEQLTSLAPAVLFSAAVPGQTGPGHINEQWPEFWSALFERRGYSPVDAIRPAVWGREDIVYWYRQNIIVYMRNDRLPANYARPVFLDIAHPELVAQYVKQANAQRIVTGREALKALSTSIVRRLRGG